MLVGVGGFIGSVLRYGVGNSLQHWSQTTRLPLGTLTVNLVGCFVIGLLSQLAETHDTFSGETRAFHFVGLIGGFTTFSAFGNETLSLLRDGSSLLAMGNVASHLTLGLAAVWLGGLIGRQV